MLADKTEANVLARSTQTRHKTRNARYYIRQVKQN